MGLVLLLYYEWQYVNYLKKKIFISPNVLLYIQNFRWSNYHQWVFWKTYLQNLSSWVGTQKKKKKQIDKNAIFLGLDIKIQNSRYQANLYDKYNLI